MGSLLRSLPWFGGEILVLLVFIFQIWMLVDAVRRDEWIWAFFIFIGLGLAAFLYFLLVYRAEGSLATRGFELPGAGSRKRIRELQDLIHHLDKPHHYLELGDIYFAKGKLDKAEQSYRAALERDPRDIDTRSHLGQCYLRQKRPRDASALLRQVVTENPKHDYGYSLMAYAEALTALGQTDEAMTAWKQVVAANSYARARVQLAELYLARGQRPEAEAELRGVIEDDRHAPEFQRKRDRMWLNRARALL